MTDRKKKNIVELTNCSPSEYKELAKIPVVLVLDNVRSMYNVGAVLRTCDAFRIERVLLCGITGTPPHPEITKTALGAEESVMWQYHNDTLEAVSKLRGEGYEICALEQAHNSVELHTFRVERDRRYAIVAGNEVAGVAQSVVDMSDHVLEIRQYGVKHSLNVSVSASIALWHFYTANL